MPLAIALLEHPAAPYLLLVTAVVALLRAAYVPNPFVAGFAGVAAAALAALASLGTPPPLVGLLLLALGTALLNVEFALATYGCAGAAGLLAAFCGSWFALDGATAPSAVGAAVRAGAALLGTAAIAATALHGWRRRTLPPEH